MSIYGALCIPAISAILMYRYFRNGTTWWKYAVPFAVSLVLVISMKLIIEKVQVSSKEYWGSFVQRAEYYEDWNEWVTQTCYTQSCDAKGENCQSIPYDCSYSVYHPAEWDIVTTTGETVSISKAEYAALKSRFGNQSYIDLHRDYYTDDGNEYTSIWQGDSLQAVSVTTVHHYENRVKAAPQSVFSYADVSKEDIERFSLKAYPPVTGSYSQDAVLGDNSADGTAANEKIKYLNALLGSRKQVKVFVCVYMNQPIEAAFYQESLWSGANMNEFVVCIGVDSTRKVKWCKPISWTPNELLKVETRNMVMEQDTLDLCKVAGYLTTAIDKGFVRRDFKEFSYLSVEPPTWSVWLTYIITLLVNLLVCFLELKDCGRFSFGNRRW